MFLPFCMSIVVVVVFIVEASASKAYPRVALVIASTLSGSVVITLSGGEGLPNLFSLIESSLGHLRSQCWIVLGSSLQRGHSGSVEGIEEIGVGFQWKSVTVSKARKEDSIHTVANGLAVFRPNEPAIHLRCPRTCWWWICECYTDEVSRRCEVDASYCIDMVPKGTLLNMCCWIL